MDQRNSHISRPSFQELNSPSFTNNRFIPHQLPPYNPHWSFSQIPTQNSEGSYSGSFTNLLQDNVTTPQSQFNSGVQPNFSTPREFNNSVEPNSTSLSELNIEVSPNSAAPPSKSKSVRKKRANKENNDSSAPVNRHWTPEADEALAKAWVSISEDSIVGVEQSSGNLWDKIFCAFNSHMKGVCSNDRNPNELACRWNQMQKECGKFQGYYDRIRCKVRSGTNLCDDIDAARTEFKSEEGISFRWDKAWAILKDEPKWNTKMLTLSNSKRKSSQIPDTSTSVRADVSEGHLDGEDPNHTHESQEETIVRPMGRKKAKERRSKFGSNESEVSNDVVEYLSRIQSTLEAQTAFALDLAKGELELLQVKKQAVEDKRKLDILKEEGRVMQFDWSKLPVELQEDWKDRQNLIRVKWMNEGRLTQRN